MMNRETFNRIYERELTPRQKKVLPLFLLGYSDDDILRELEGSDRTLITQHLKNISKKFAIFPEKDTDYRNSLVELCWKYKPDLVSPERLKMSGLIAGKPPYPDSPLRIDSPFYLERPPLELNCYQLLTEPGTLLRINSPHKMGKTSLIRKIIANAKQNNYYTVSLDLSLIETERLTNTKDFLVSFYDYLIQELPSAPPLKDWKENTSATLNLTKDMQHLLKHLGKVLVLVLDELDTLFNYPQIYQDFLPMLRHWYEKMNTTETWENLRLVISHATDDYGKLNINQSPFNVGIPIKLEEFNREQVQNLGFLHGLTTDSVLPLIDLVGGHPYLLRLAFYNLYYQQVSVKQLINEATTEKGIYRYHLLCLLETLQERPELRSIFVKIINGNGFDDLTQKSLGMYQLESMGLIKFENNSVNVRCKLYQEYFRDRL